ncbi:hypothetical protein GOC53_28215 [Sinorhizobium medicae]|nr:hypothetical protein [Sinorhizobium medicae]MDX0533013.1 hypothetical protein [Sinorhizobium medicae]MDX0997695.1 hypothetical protein [Sinorhizobium medicae]MDX1181528.1 hypothetical protein [Sinorhizobium medicae]
MLTWLTSSNGKLVAKWAAFAAVAVAVYWKIYADGQAAERAKQVAEKLDAVRERERIQDEVSKLPDADVRGEPSRWVRHDG